MSDLHDIWPDDDVDQIAIAGLRGGAVAFVAAPLRANESRKLERGLRNFGILFLRNRLPSAAHRTATVIATANDQ
jgi:hypothetical protein